MKLSDNKILITGGSSGLGLEMAKRLLESGNTVIICSRSAEKLSEAKELFPPLIVYPFDIADAASCTGLAEWIRKEHPDLNVVINNAAVVHRTDFLADPDTLAKSELEIQTNFLGPVRLIKHLYGSIKANDKPAIINITTGLIYAPKADYPFYNATKAALHSFTQTLRLKWKTEGVEVIEVMFPVVDTPWHAKGEVPKIAITTENAVEQMLAGIKKGKAEIRVGGVKLLYPLSRIMPGVALKFINNLSNRNS
jgi:uncharacterized oxidoreductase